MNDDCLSVNSYPSIRRNNVPVRNVNAVNDVQNESRIEIIVNGDENQRNSDQRSQTGPINDDSMVADDFFIELPSSFTFKIQSVDLAKLSLIRNKKIERKKNLLLEKMGLLNINDLTLPSKRILLSTSRNESHKNNNTNVHHTGKRH